MSAGDALARPRALRRQLLSLTFGTLLPVIAVAVLGAVLLAQHQRLTFERGARERTLAILTAIATQLKGCITSLSALASTHNLDGDDLSVFHDAMPRCSTEVPMLREIAPARWLACHLNDVRTDSLQ